MSQQRAVIFDLETVPDLAAGRELLKADSGITDEQVRRMLGERYARPGEDPNNAFVKVLLQRIVCIGAIFAERIDEGPWIVARSGVGHIGLRSERELVESFVDNRLAALAAGIRAEHQATAAALRRSLEHAMAAGEFLIEAKAQLKHGEWIAWLRDHCALSDRTARLYMRLARNRSEIEHQIGNVADLSVRGAVALIAAPSQSQLADFVPLVVDAALDDLQSSDFKRAKVERDNRRLAFAAIDLTLRTITELADKDARLAAEAAWASLGERLMSAIADCKNLLLEEDSQRATAAIVIGKDVASEMLKHVEAARGSG